MFALIHYGTPASRSECTTSTEAVDLQGRLERDLERLQGLLDASVGEMRAAFERVAEMLDSPANSGPAGPSIRDEVRCAAGCLRFHSVASQLIADLQGRVALLQLVTAGAREANTRPQDYP